MGVRGRSRGGRWATIVPAGYSALLTLVVAAPLLGPGYLLLRDAVSTPRSYLTDAALGLGDAAPRAVPQDALLAALSTVVDGGVAVKVILLAALWGAGYGAAVLARTLLGAPIAAQLVAVTVAIWNPFVAERLLQGHWSLLTGYAALPWTALVAHRLRRRLGSRYRDWAALGGCFAAAGLTPTGALLAGVVGLTVAGRRNVLGALALLTAASAPWLVATIASGAGTETSDPAGIAAFAARAEPALGTLGSLAGLGGIWNADAVPWSRTTPLTLIGTAILLVLVALGTRTVAAGPLRPRSGTDDAPAIDSAPLSSAAARTAATSAPDEADAGRSGSRPAEHGGDRHPADRSTSTPGPESARTGRRLLGLAVAAVLLPALGATAPGMDILEWLVVEVPGAGLLRDTQKYVALAMPAYALCAAAGCTVLAARFGPRIPTGPQAISGGTATPPGTEQPIGHPQAPREKLGSTAPTGSAEPTEHSDTPAATGTAERGTTDSADGATPAHVADGRPDRDPRTSAHSTGSPRFPDTPHRPSSPALAAVAALFIAALILPLIDLAWGVGGEMRAVRYPAAWQEAAARVDGPGDVAVLPGGMFRRFPYSGSAPVLDPAPRMLPNDVLQTGELPVRGQRVSGEGVRARRVERLLLDGASPAELAALGVGWVLVEHRTPGPMGAAETTLTQLDPVLRTPDLSLYRVPGEIAEETSTHRPLVIAAHVLWAALLLAPLLAFLPSPRRSHRNR